MGEAKRRGSFDERVVQAQRCRQEELDRAAKEHLEEVQRLKERGLQHAVTGRGRTGGRLGIMMAAAAAIGGGFGGRRM